MSGNSRSQLSVCWLHGHHPTELESVKDNTAFARLDAFPLAGLLKGYGKSKSFQTVAECCRTADAVVIEWEVESAPVVSVLRLHSTPRSVPFIAIDSAESSDARIMARLMWADDVVTPPITDRLIRASIQSHIRSVTTTSGPGERADIREGPETLEIGPIRLNIRAHRVLINEEEISMTPLRFELLRYFVEHHDELVTRSELMSNVWDIDYERNSNSVDVIIYHLRSLLDKYDLETCIQTVRGKGYRFVVPDTT